MNISPYPKTYIYHICLQSNHTISMASPRCVNSQGKYSLLGKMMLLKSQTVDMLYSQLFDICSFQVKFNLVLETRNYRTGMLHLTNYHCVLIDPNLAHHPRRLCSCWTHVKKHHIYGLVQNCSNSSALAMELLQSCTKPSKYDCIVSYSSPLIDTGTSFFTEDNAWFTLHIRYNGSWCPGNWNIEYAQRLWNGFINNH